MKKLNQKNNSASKGFTLIELVVVIGILAVLFAIVLIAINPGRQFAQANDTKRRSDVNAILNSVSQYAADHKGSLSALSIGSSEVLISNSGADICDELVPMYISALPFDPNKTTSNCGTGVSSPTYDSGYKIVQDSNGRVTVSASPEVSGATISVTR